MKLSTLHLRDLKSLDGLKSVTAASGLVKIKNKFYVIADDQLTLASFDSNSNSSLEMFPLLPGHLPIDFKERKKKKPDWESLCHISFDGLNGLLAVPSGSTKNRELGIFIHFDDQVISKKSPLTVSFSELYTTLRQSFSDLNIEGSLIFNHRLKLFQRGNGAQSVNAIIEIDLNGLISDVKRGRAVKAQNVTQIKIIDLGELNKVPLGFTDACACGDQIWFLAAAENTNSTYHDGAFCGALLGALNQDGDILFRHKLDCAQKPEGLWIEMESQERFIYFVTDADNPNMSSALYLIRLEN